MTTHREQNEAIRDQFSKQAPSYARLASGGKNTMLEPLLAALRPTAADQLLDVGCGPGRLSLSLAEFVEQVTGIDLTPEMLEQARALQAELGVANARWQQGDILPMPFADGAFSIIVTQATFHHLADPGAVLAEMKRVCGPGGRIAVIDLTPDPAKREAFDRIETLRDPSHLHVLSVDDLRGLGRTAGLEELDCHHFATSLPFEAVLATSFPGPGIVEEVRALLREDAASGQDRLGFSARMENGEVFVTYPMTMVAWRRP